MTSAEPVQFEGRGARGRGNEKEKAGGRQEEL